MAPSLSELGWFRSDRTWWTDAPAKNQEITDSFPAQYALETALPRVVLLATTNGLVSGAALAHKAGGADTFRRRLKFTQWLLFAEFDIQRALEQVSGTARSSADNTVSKPVGKFTKHVTSALIKWIQENHEQARKALAALSLDEGPEWLQQPDSTAAQVYASQIDGLKVGLDIAGIDRSAAMDLIPISLQADDLRVDKIATTLLEDQIVLRDVHTFPSWLPATTAFGAEFEDPSTGRRLQTFLANKLPLEESTGADVIYHVEDFNSFVLVQYKRCRMEGTVPIYRPDGQLDIELARLRLLEATVNDVEVALPEYRLGPPFCFAKLCDPRQPLQPGLSVGMYFDLKTFESVMTRGKRNGLVLRYGEAARYITNTTFSGLVADGWIGSSGKRTEGVLTAMETGLDEHRSVFLHSIRLGDNPRGRHSQAVRARGFPSEKFR